LRFGRYFGDNDAVYSWPGADPQLMWQSERTGIENKWFALTGRVVDVRIEMDGDLHIALKDATGNRAGKSNNGVTILVRRVTRLGANIHKGGKCHES